MNTVNVLFVCLGNICRSPTAQGIFQQMVVQRGLENDIEVDSAGTGGWHIGRPPDQRAQVAALQRGYDLSHLRARQVTADDFDIFDYVLAMDNQNLHDLQRLKRADFGGYLGLFLPFANSEVCPDEVPDPYYGGRQRFDQVLDMVESASQGLLNHICTQQGWSQK